MLSSMTGFGSDTYSDNKFTLETEIKSLNSRYLDLSIKLPKELSQHEFAIRDLIRENLIRGKVSVNINLILHDFHNDQMIFDKEAFNETISNIEKIKKNANIDNALSLEQILVFKDYIIHDSEAKFEFDLELLKGSVTRAINSLLKMRQEEGSHLSKDIDFRISSISENLSKIEEISKYATNEYFEKFKEKAKKLVGEFVDDEDRFLIELGILSEKHDVTEECTRLKSHIKLFNEAIGKAYDIGRRLNFICQEMNREVNTINSKSVSSEISHLGINIKEELEKVREQVQNIE